MRKDEKTNFNFYYPENEIDIFEGREIVVKYEKKGGTDYENGDLVRIVYGVNADRVEWQNCFEAFSPLVSNVATFYLPIPYVLLSRILAHDNLKKEVDWSIQLKTKDSSDFDTGGATTLHSVSQSHIIFMGGKLKLPPIPVFFYSERGAGKFNNKQLNVQRGAYFDEKPKSALRLRVGTRTYVTISHTDREFLGTGKEGLCALKMLKFLDGKIQAIKLCGNLEENYVQLIWAEHGSQTIRAFWFHVKEIENSSENWGTIQESKKLRGTDVDDTLTVSRELFSPTQNLTLSSGFFDKKIIDTLKKIVKSPIIWRYNSQSKEKTEAATESQLTELKREIGGIPISPGSLMAFKFTATPTDNQFLGVIKTSSPDIFSMSVRLRINSGGDPISRVHFDLFQNTQELERGNPLTRVTFRTEGYESQKYDNFDLDKTQPVAPRIRVSCQNLTQELVLTIEHVWIMGYVGAYEMVEIERDSLVTRTNEKGYQELELKMKCNEKIKPDWVVI